MASWFSPSVLALLTNPVFYTVILLPVALILLDWLSGIASAFHRGIFQWNRIADFFYTNIIQKYIGALVTIGISYFAAPAPNQALIMTMATTVGIGVISASLLSSIYANCREFLSPLEMSALESLGTRLGLPDTLPAPDPGAASLPATPLVPQQVQPFLPSASPLVSSSTSSSLIAPIPLDSWMTQHEVPVVGAPHTSA